MPICCQQTKIQFNNATSTTIAYTQSMREQYGAQPRVFVWYYDNVTNEFYQSTFLTVMHFDGNNIIIDHGGPNTGIIVIT